MDVFSIYHGREVMEDNQIKGNWDLVKGKAKETWGKLTNDELSQINGKKDQLVGKIEKAYGLTKEQAIQQVKDFESKLS